jgi:hypothetical protein
VQRDVNPPNCARKSPVAGLLFVIRKCEMRTYGPDECKSIGRRLTVAGPNVLPQRAKMGFSLSGEAGAMVEQRHARAAHENDEHGPGNKPADVRPPCDRPEIGHRHHDDLRCNPDAKHQARRDA